MTLLKYGMKGEAVAELQRALTAHGHPVADDGDFGEKTEAAVTAFQTACGLMADGKAGRDTLAALAGEDTSRVLKEADIRAAAEILAVEPAVIKAVVHVESAGSGYLPDGRVKILFERHVFRRELEKAHGKAAAAEAEREAPHICAKTPGGYRGGTAEYPRLARAMTIDPECGMKAASWGLFQIMGFNYAAAGHSDIHSFVDAVKKSEGEQLLAFARFVASDKAMLSVLQAKDWAAFAERYNGRAYKKNHYDAKLANAYARYAAKEKTA